MQRKILTSGTERPVIDAKSLVLELAQAQPSAEWIMASASGIYGVQSPFCHLCFRYCDALWVNPNFIFDHVQKAETIKAGLTEINQMMLDFLNSLNLKAPIVNPEFKDIISRSVQGSNKTDKSTNWERNKDWIIKTSNDSADFASAFVFCVALSYLLVSGKKTEAEIAQLMARYDQEYSNSREFSGLLFIMLILSYYAERNSLDQSLLFKRISNPDTLAEYLENTKYPNDRIEVLWRSVVPLVLATAKPEDINKILTTIEPFLDQEIPPQVNPAFRTWAHPLWKLAVVSSNFTISSENPANMSTILQDLNIARGLKNPQKSWFEIYRELFSGKSTLDMDYANMNNIQQRVVRAGHFISTNPDAILFSLATRPAANEQNGAAVWVGSLTDYLLKHKGNLASLHPLLSAPLWTLIDPQAVDTTWEQNRSSYFTYLMNQPFLDNEKPRILSAFLKEASKDKQLETAILKELDRLLPKGKRPASPEIIQMAYAALRVPNIPKSVQDNIFSKLDTRFPKHPVLSLLRQEIFQTKRVAEKLLRQITEQYSKPDALWQAYFNDQNEQYIVYMIIRLRAELEAEPWNIFIRSFNQIFSNWKTVDATLLAEELQKLLGFAGDERFGVDSEVVGLTLMISQNSQHPLSGLVKQITFANGDEHDNVAFRIKVALQDDTILYCRLTNTLELDIAGLRLEQHSVARDLLFVSILEQIVNLPKEQASDKEDSQATGALIESVARN